VHLRTALPEGATVPLGWIAVGDPAERGSGSRRKHFPQYALRRKEQNFFGQGPGSEFGRRCSSCPPWRASGESVQQLYLLLCWRPSPNKIGGDVSCFFQATTQKQNSEIANLIEHLGFAAITPRQADRRWPSQQFGLPRNVSCGSESNRIILAGVVSPVALPSSQCGTSQSFPFRSIPSHVVRSPPTITSTLNCRTPSSSAMAHPQSRFS